MKPGINIYGSAEETVKAFSIVIKDLVEKIPGSKDDFSIALSGGKTAPLLFDYLAENNKENINWRKISLYWVDERCVPPNHPDSNYGIAYQHLIKHIKIPKENVHRIRGENDPSKEADRYSQEIKENLKEQNKIPHFDLIILGMGEDGHTASIFPDQMEIMHSNKICEVTLHPQSKQKRVTLTGRVINNASHISFLVTGKSKAAIASQVLNNNINSEKYPAAQIKPNNGILEWYLDNEASMLL
jgi:6-phosphogluconolactonase